MNIITLTTDFGTQEYSVAALKGKLLHLIPMANVVDITHEISPFDVAQAAYTFGRAYGYFPPKTIHIVGVDSECTEKKSFLLLQRQGHIFICPDNGFISLLWEEISPEEIYRFSAPFPSSFPLLDFIPEVVAQITQGTPLSALGVSCERYAKKSRLVPQVAIDNQSIVANIIHIDHYGNVVSNISRELLEKVANGRRFDVFFRYIRFQNIGIEDIENQYNSIEKTTKDNIGREMLLFNHSHLLELAIYRSNPKTSGGAATLLGLRKGEQIRISFL